MPTVSRLSLCELDEQEIRGDSEGNDVLLRNFVTVRPVQVRRCLCQQSCHEQWYIGGVCLKLVRTWSAEMRTLRQSHIYHLRFISQRARKFQCPLGSMPRSWIEQVPYADSDKCQPNNTVQKMAAAPVPPAMICQYCSSLSTNDGPWIKVAGP